MPTTVVSVGFRRKEREAGLLAADPVDQFARAGARAIGADQALPRILQSGVKGCTISSRCPSSWRPSRWPTHTRPPGQKHALIQLHVVDDADDGVIDRISLQPSAMRAELPDTAITRSRNPALTVSTVTT